MEEPCSYELLLLLSGLRGEALTLSAVEILSEISGTALGAASEWGGGGINDVSRLCRQSRPTTLAV
ncbi:MAG: hypothetical protein KME57_08780 [Scytonema hyalinum WJT4-NPBG1]|nr:hypothetical protein [Scytonema hyalinum WJT4-NPBG1]